jgi:phospholipase C
MSIPQDLKHFVVLMMENRSFDHVLGALTKIHGRRDVDGIDDFVSYVDREGQVHVPARVSPARASSFYPDPAHNSRAVKRQLENGFLKAFQDDYPQIENQVDIIGYLTRDDLPVTYFLADEFTICDRWFCSVPTGTVPNRLYAMAGHADGKRDNPAALASARVKTVFERLQEKGVSWKAYYEVFPSMALRFNRKTPPFFKRTERFRSFLKDAGGTRDPLPAFSWIEPIYSWAEYTLAAPPSNDDHPPSYVQRGQALIRQVYEALRSGPYWSQSALLIVYDEHGGFADHVQPEPAPGIRDGFTTYGPRVPAIVVSPFAPRGGVFNQTLDHCSILKFVCEWLGANFGVSLAPASFSPRVATARSLAEIFQSTARDDRPVAPPAPPLSAHASVATHPLSPFDDLAVPMLALRTSLLARHSELAAMAMNDTD